VIGTSKEMFATYLLPTYPRKVYFVDFHYLESSLHVFPLSNTRRRKSCRNLQEIVAIILLLISSLRLRELILRFPLVFLVFVLVLHCFRPRIAVDGKIVDSLERIKPFLKR
jgi:hypothetical protein